MKKRKNSSYSGRLFTVFRFKAKYFRFCVLGTFFGIIKIIFFELTGGCKSVGYE